MRPPGSRLGKARPGGKGGAARRQRTARPGNEGGRGPQATPLPRNRHCAQVIFAYFFQRVSASFLGAEKPPLWSAL